MVDMLFTLKQKILIILFERGPLQNSNIARDAGITEQWCSELIRALQRDGLVESVLLPPRRINRLSRKGVEVARHLKEISEKVGG